MGLGTRGAGASGRASHTHGTRGPDRASGASGRNARGGKSGARGTTGPRGNSPTIARGVTGVTRGRELARVGTRYSIGADRSGRATAYGLASSRKMAAVRQRITRGFAEETATARGDVSRPKPEQVESVPALTAPIDLLRSRLSRKGPMCLAARRSVTIRGRSSVLVERIHGMDEVTSSSLVASTRRKTPAKAGVVVFGTRGWLGRGQSLRFNV